MAKNIYGFNQPKRKHKALTVLEVLLIIICAFIILSMLSLFVLFHKEDAMPNIFGTNIFITRATNMEPKIPANSAIFADSDKLDTIAPGSVVLCTVSNETSSANVILRVQQIMQNQDGTASYILKGDTNSSNETIKVSKENLVGLCVTYSKPFGSLVVFATSQMGILCSIIVPCILIIIIQVIHILKYRKGDDDDDYEYDDDDEEDEDDEDDEDSVEIDERERVLFSTRNSSYADDDEEEYRAPVRKPTRTYIENEGKAVYTNTPKPNASADELYEKLYSSGQSPLRRPSQASRQTEEGRKTVSENFRQKPTSSNMGYQRMSEMSKEIHTEPPVNPYRRSDDEYEPRKLYYEKTPSQQVVLDPPKVENPVSVTIPSEAVMPKETIAPPPKKTNNKTVEELMNMIDQAQRK